MLALFGAAILSVAWVTEDAYITFRTVDNFLDGYGLRWNPAERVQSYTHPLWMFVLSASGLVTRKLFLSAIALNVACALGAAAIIAFRLAKSSWHAALAISILTGSLAFRDYSTSGLENSLAHLLLALFSCLALTRERPPILALALLLSAICLNRQDHAVIAGPAFAWCFYRAPDPRALAVGAIPIAAWEVFSIYYYGVPFPNTAYAKLSTGLEPDWLMSQGLAYLRTSLVWDPLTLGAILAGSVAAVVSRRGMERAAAIGIAAYLIYLVRIGGDFMAGRFLTAPLVVAVILLARMSFGWLRPVTWGIALAVAAALGLAGLRPHTLQDSTGIADERLHYLEITLARYRDSPDFPEHPFYQRAAEDIRRGAALIIRQNIGLLGYRIGRRTHIVDYLALSDPMLARLPMLPSPWRVGHYRRDPPPGYIESLQAGRNMVADPGLAKLWDDLVLLTRAPLDAPGRWAAIWRVNSRAHERAIAEWASPEPVTYGDAAVRAVSWYRGIEIRLPVESTASVEVECESNDFYYVMFLRGGKRLGGADIQQVGLDPVLRSARVTPPPEAAGGFDAIRVHPRWGDGQHRVGRVVLIR